MVGPEKIICVGVNYANRNAELSGDADIPGATGCVLARHSDTVESGRGTGSAPPE